MSITNIRHGTPNMADHLENEVALVSEAQAGNTEAFNTLVNKYDRKVYRLALHITANPEDAEDVLQETFLKVYLNLGGFEGKSRFYTWLVRIAVNESLMKVRRQRRNRQMASLDEPIQTGEYEVLPRQIVDWHENPEKHYSRRELQQILRDALGQLKPAHRTAFVLHHVEDLSTKDTAALLDIPVSTTKSRLLRALLELRERLNQYFKGPISECELGGSNEQAPYRLACTLLQEHRDNNRSPTLLLRTLTSRMR